MTSTQLWNMIKSEYDGKYKTFTSLMVRYQRYGYITKQGKKPYIYKLTPFGVENANNPYMLRDEQKRRYKQYQIDAVGSLLHNNPDYLRQLAGMDIGGSGYSDGVRHNSSNDFGDSIDYHKNDAEKQELLDKIKELKESNESLEYQLELAEQKTPTMIINQSPQPQQQEVKASNERSFDSTLWAYKDQRMTVSAYHKLPYQIVRVAAFPKGNVSEEIKRLLKGKKIVGLITVPYRAISTLTKYGFVEHLKEQEIESLMMKFIDGYVYLVSGQAKFRITTVPKKQSKPDAQKKVVIKTRQD